MLTCTYSQVYILCTVHTLHASHSTDSGSVCGAPQDPLSPALTSKAFQTWSLCLIIFTNDELTEVCTPGKNHGFSVSVMLMLCTTCCSNVISSVADGKYPTQVQFGRSAAASGSSGMVLLEVHCLKLLRFLWDLRLEAGRSMMKPSTAIAAPHRSPGFAAPVHAWTDQLPWNAKCIVYLCQH